MDHILNEPLLAHQRIKKEGDAVTCHPQFTLSNLVIKPLFFIFFFCGKEGWLKGYHQPRPVGGFIFISYTF